MKLPEIEAEMLGFLFQFASFISNWFLINLKKKKKRRSCFWVLNMFVFATKHQVLNCLARFFVEFVADGSPTRVGFLGLGIMGTPMAQNLIKAGYDMT